MHYAVQSSDGKPSHPFGQDKMGPKDWISPNDFLRQERSNWLDRVMSKTLPPSYIILWLVLFLVYFM